MLLLLLLSLSLSLLSLSLSLLSLSLLLMPVTTVSAAQIEDYGLVSFVPMNILDEESVELVLAHIDHAMQFGEEAEPKEPEEVPEADSHAVDA